MLTSQCRLLLIGLALSSAVSAAEPVPAGVVCLLEDNAAELLPKLTNPGGDPGNGEVEKDIVFSGGSSTKITILQRYCNFIPGWKYRIVEKPKEGEYRYLRFAWKSDGLSGIMLQLHDDKDWHIRYTAGANKFGWESLTLSDKLPTEWTLVTIDLFKDFGEREIHGIALTTFDGVAGYFDHIYLGRTVEELDAIDATGLSGKGPLKLTDDEVELHYKQLISSDASLAYRAFWTLAAGGESAAAALRKKLRGDLADVDAKRIAAWIMQLDDDGFEVREQATKQLIENVALARKSLERELAGTASAEVRTRLEAILATGNQELTELKRTEQQSRRILEIIAARTKIGSH
jgi:hypothetical protein